MEHLFYVYVRIPNLASYTNLSDNKEIVLEQVENKAKPWHLQLHLKLIRQGTISGAVKDFFYNLSGEL